jgi:hypothetical protein
VNPNQSITKNFEKYRQLTE